MRALWLAVAAALASGGVASAQKMCPGGWTITDNDGNPICGPAAAPKTCALGWVMVDVATRAGLLNGIPATVMKCAPAGDLVDPR